MKILHNCNGIVSLFYKKSSFSIKFNHVIYHDTHSTKPCSSELTKQRINSLCDTGFSPFQILNIVHKEGLEMVFYQDVYNVRCKKMSQKYVGGKNPRIYIKRNLEYSENLSLLCTQEKTFGIVFHTKIAS